jgi:hypothetical protein
MRNAINVLFEFLRDKHSQMVDLTHLKAYFFNENVQNLNPTLFKRVNDLAEANNNEKSLSSEEFTSLLLNEHLMELDVSKKQEPPTLD